MLVSTFASMAGLLVSTLFILVWFILSQKTPNEKLLFSILAEKKQIKGDPQVEISAVNIIKSFLILRYLRKSFPDQMKDRLRQFKTLSSHLILFSSLRKKYQYNCQNEKYAKSVRKLFRSVQNTSQKVQKGVHQIRSLKD
mmetsp:Transcript_16568/g.28194  ORF Transcript_16568/g.28194 Transcript_16568/m.28194 type:complete len:140 (+) Transcript_16568:937-1356(+)